MFLIESCFMWRKHLIGIGILLAIVLGWIWFYPLKPLTSDKKLIKNFYQHQSAFEQVVKMAKEDSEVKMIYEDYVSLKNYETWLNDSQEGFSTKRWNEYKEIFNQLGEGLHYVSKRGDILEIDSASIAVKSLEGLESIVISKGYAYSLKEPSHLVDSLDELGFEDTGTYYKKIEGNWYLYFNSGISKPE